MLVVKYYKNQFNKRFNYEFIIFINLIILYFTIDIEIISRLLNYTIFFNIILFTNYIHSSFLNTSNTFSSFYAYFTFTLKISFLMIFISYPLFIPVNGKFGVKNFDRYYPYSSIFNEKEDFKREKLFRFYNAY
jgi:hypothetical protein